MVPIARRYRVIDEALNATVKVNREARCAEPAECIWAHSAEPATNYAVRWRAFPVASRSADAVPAEACCFRQSRSARHGHCGSRKDFPRLNYGRSWMEISASRRDLPVRALRDLVSHLCRSVLANRFFPLRSATYFRRAGVLQRAETSASRMIRRLC